MTNYNLKLRDDVMAMTQEGRVNDDTLLEIAICQMRKETTSDID